MLIFHGYQFYTVNWSCQSQLLLNKDVMTSHPDKSYVKYQNWEGPGWAGSMTGVQGMISHNSPWKGKRRNSFALKKFTHWFPDPAVCQLNKQRKKTNHKNAHLGAPCILTTTPVVAKCALEIHLWNMMSQLEVYFSRFAHYEEKKNCESLKPSFLKKNIKIPREDYLCKHFY